MHTNPVVLMGLALVIVCLALLAFETSGLRSSRYVEKQILTHSEILFFHRLRIAADRVGLWVFPQVAFSAFMAPKAKGKAAISDFRRISQKRADFVVVRADTMEIICLVELDDRTHDVAADKARDRLTGSAGLVTIRWHVEDKVTTDQIYSRLASRLQDLHTSSTSAIMSQAQ